MPNNERKRREKLIHISGLMIKNNVAEVKIIYYFLPLYINDLNFIYLLRFYE